jgi:hypothetical protein
MLSCRRLITLITLFQRRLQYRPWHGTVAKDDVCCCCGRAVLVVVGPEDTVVVFVATDSSAD